MRPIINATFVSLDGVMNHMDKWHFGYVNDETAQITYDQLASCDAMLMGRKTYEIYAATWPTREGAYPESDQLDAKICRVDDAGFADVAEHHGLEG